MEDLRAYEIMPVEPISDTERRQRAWILKRKLKKKLLKKLQEKPKSKIKKHKIDIYI